LRSGHQHQVGFYRSPWIRGAQRVHLGNTVSPTFSVAFMMLVGVFLDPSLFLVFIVRILILVALGVRGVRAKSFVCDERRPGSEGGSTVGEGARDEARDEATMALAKESPDLRGVMRRGWSCARDQEKTSDDVESESDSSQIWCAKVVVHGSRVLWAHGFCCQLAGWNEELAADSACMAELATGGP
ncbi:hypothetical protein KCU90_g156, partial [Aureobasidium melanogenum]